MTVWTLARVLMLACVLTGCAKPRTVVRTEIVEVRVPAYKPLAIEVTRPVAVPKLPPGRVTNEDLAENREAILRALKAANVKLKSIQDLQPK